MSEGLLGVNGPPGEDKITSDSVTANLEEPTDTTSVGDDPIQNQPRRAAHRAKLGAEQRQRLTE